MKRKKSVRIIKGTSLLTATERTEKERKVYQSSIDKCLNCTKPASKCKGDCK